jgi:hypothetical protein
MASRVLSGVTDAEATADLSARIRAVLEAAGSQVERTSAVADSNAEGPLHRVSLDLEFLTDTPGTFSILSNLVSGSPVISAERVRIAPAASGGSPAESLRVSLRVSGWYLQPDSVQ